LLRSKKKPVRSMDRQTLENLFIVIILALIFAIVIFCSGLQYRTPDTTASYTVKPGDTLWEIAEIYCPTSHTGNVVNKIERLNDIDGHIYPGQVLEVPYESLEVAKER